MQGQKLSIFTRSASASPKGGNESGRGNISSAELARRGIPGTWNQESEVPTSSGTGTRIEMLQIDIYRQGVQSRFSQFGVEIRSIKCELKMERWGKPTLGTAFFRPLARVLDWPKERLAAAFATPLYI